MNPEVTIIFKGDNEFEAQMARDILTQAGVPVLHVPSLSTGVFGFRQTTGVAVPESFADQAVTTLTEAGLTASRQPRPQGAKAVQTMFQDAFPQSVSSFLVKIIILGILFVLVLWILGR